MQTTGHTEEQEIQFYQKTSERAGKALEKINKNIWTDETKVFKKRETAHNLKYAASSVRHGGGSIMVRTCKPAGVY